MKKLFSLLMMLMFCSFTFATKVEVEKSTKCQVSQDLGVTQQIKADVIVFNSSDYVLDASPQYFSSVNYNYIKKTTSSQMGNRVFHKDPGRFVLNVTR